MELKGSKQYDKDKPVRADPFRAIGRANGSADEPGGPVGPGIGSNRKDVAAAPANKRRSAASHVFGDTPARDGPFATSAAPVATNYPTNARARQDTKKRSGPNPFGDST